MARYDAAPMYRHVTVLPPNAKYDSAVPVASEYRFLANAPGTAANPNPNGNDAKSASVKSTVPGGKPVAPANGRTTFCCHSAIEAYARSDMIRGARAVVSTVRAWKPKEARVVVCVCAILVGFGWVF